MIITILCVQRAESPQWPVPRGDRGPSFRGTLNLLRLARTTPPRLSHFSCTFLLLCVCLCVCALLRCVLVDGTGTFRLSNFVCLVPLVRVAVVVTPPQRSSSSSNFSFLRVRARARARVHHSVQVSHCFFFLINFVFFFTSVRVKNSPFKYLHE